MLELERDGAVGEGLGEHGVRVGDVVGVGEQMRGGERRGKGARREREVEGVVVRVGKGVAVAVGEGAEDDEGVGGGGRLWV